MNFANNLVSIRESQHISRRQFADALGVTTAAIANWETGKREPNLTTLRAIANYFMVTPDDLLADMPSNDNSWILQMQNLLKKTSFRIDNIDTETCTLYYAGTPVFDIAVTESMPHCQIQLNLLKGLYDHRFQAMSQFFSDSLYRTFVQELAKHSAND